MQVFKVFTFEAAHRLPNVPADHKCARLHGHSFRAEVHVIGPLVQPEDWVIDFADIKELITPLAAQLDHHYLNDIEGLSNPTSENIAKWIWERLHPQLPNLKEILVQETCTSGCIYRGEEDS